MDKDHARYLIMVTMIDYQHDFRALNTFETIKALGVHIPSSILLGQLDVALCLLLATGLKLL